MLACVHNCNVLFNVFNSIIDFQVHQHNYVTHYVKTVNTKKKKKKKLPLLVCKVALELQFMVATLSPEEHQLIN